MQVTIQPGPSYVGNRVAAAFVFAGSDASHDGDHETAEILFIQGRNLNSHVFGPDSVQTGAANYGLGRECLVLGKPHYAEMALRHSVHVLEAGGAEYAPRAAIARETLARVFEVKGEWENARETRCRRLGEMVCGNLCEDMSLRQKEQMVKCRHCHSVWYCSQACLNADSKLRHKAHCTSFAGQEA